MENLIVYCDSELNLTGEQQAQINSVLAKESGGIIPDHQRKPSTDPFDQIYIDDQTGISYGVIHKTTRGSNFSLLIQVLSRIKQQLAEGIDDINHVIVIISSSVSDTGKSKWIRIGENPECALSFDINDSVKAERNAIRKSPKLRMNQSEKSRAA